jgi:DNA-binding beta-propeller fold protein YncE
MNSMQSRIKRWHGTIFSLLIAAMFFACLPSQTYADGGAPNLAYVSGTAQDISVIDVGLSKVIATIPIAGKPDTILLSLDGSLLYISQPEAHQLSILATYTKRIICTAHLSGKPGLLALDPSTNILYVAGSEASQVSAIDAHTCALRHIFATDSSVYGLAVATGGAANKTHQLWVSETDKIAVFDAQTGHPLAQLPIPGGPQYLTAPPGSTIYTTTRQGAIYAIGLKTHVTRQLLTGGPFGPMDYDAITGEIYVPDQKNSQLAVLSPADPTNPQQPRQPNRTIHTPVIPESVAITNDGQLGFVALRNGTVAMLDAPARQFVSTITVGGSPHFIITGVYPPIIARPTPPAREQEAGATDSWWNQLPAWASTSIFIVYIIVCLSLATLFVILLRRVIKNRQQQ